MAFGFEARNNSEAVLLSSSYPVLVYSHRGQIVVQNTSVVDRPAVGSVAFPSPIQQVPPPKIFLRFNTGRHNTCNIYLSMNGSANNWTGFTLYAGAIGGGTLPRHVFDYVICKLTDPTPPTGFGMAIYDASGNPTYKSQDRLVRYNKFTSSWSHTDFESGFQVFQNLRPIGITIASDDYVELSSMNRCNAHFGAYNPYSTYYSTQVLSGGTRVLWLVRQNSSSSITFPLEIGNTLFCIPICKFPVSDYP